MSSRSQLMLDKYVDTEKFKILFVQESGTCDKEKLKLSNMKTVTDTNKSRNRGAVLYIHNSISSTSLLDIPKLSNSIDSAWAITVLGNKRYIVGSIYVKLSHRNAITETLQMLNSAEQKREKLKASGVLLMGDFNARHSLWGDKVINDYGKELVEKLDFNLFSISTAPKPTFLCENGGSFIDLVIMSNSIANQIKPCSTDETTELFSGAPIRGHVPLLTALNSYVNRPTTVTEKLNVDAINWTDWSGELERQILNNIVETVNTDDPEKLWEFMESKISEANNIHGKMKKSTRHSKPYWTEKLTMLCNRMKEARKLYMKRNTDRNKEMMVNTKECFDNERKRLCQEFIIESTKSLNAAESAEFWKKFKAMFANTGEKGVDPLSDDNLGIITENSEIEDKLFDTFFESKHLHDADLDDDFYEEIMREYDDLQSDTNDPTETNATNPQSILNTPITVNEIKAAIKKTKSNNKGLDNHNMHPKMLHSFGDNALKLLEKLFNKCLDRGQWVWDKAKVIFLKKEGKESYSVPGSYRPISISSYIGKLLEKILAKRIVRYLEAIGVFDPNQEGFTSKRNTIRYLNRLNIQVKYDLSDKKAVIGLFIDFEKAFDSIWKKGLIVKMSRLNISGKILKLIDNFLENRKVMLDVNGEVGGIRNTKAYGLPQGSALAPFLFKIYLLDILEDFEETEGITVLKFADDGTVIISAETIEQCLELLNQVMGALNRWSRKWRMVINCQKNKTEYVCFSNAKRDQDVIPASVKLGEKDILKVTETKVLGLVVDDKLSYTPHSQMVQKKLLGKWANICKYSNNHWGFNQKVIVQIAKSLFLSSLHYAGLVWMNTKNMAEIESLWYRIVKAATGAVFNVRKSTAEIIVGLPPLRIQNRINKIKHFLKLNINPAPVDKLRDLITICYRNQQEKSIPVELSSCLKEVFKFLAWKVETSPNDFTETDLEVVNENRVEDYFTLSMKACSYTKELMNKYTEKIWGISIKNELNMNGFQHIPRPSCNKLPVPATTARSKEVILMSLMYQNNLFNSNVYRHTYQVESPLCRKCKLVEETPYHIILQCSDKSEEAKQSLREVITEEELQIEDTTTLLNGSRHQPFLKLCLDIISGEDYSTNIDL